MSLPSARIGACVVATLMLSASTSAQAQGAKQPSPAAKDTARTLLIDCRAKLGKNDLEGALKSCQGAHAIMGVPTTGLDLAKVQQAMGKLIEARETSREAVHFDNSANNPAFAQAQTEAAQLEKDLDGRIPSLVISVVGAASGANVKVLVDTDEVPAAALTLPFRVNPGERKVVASVDGTTRSEQLVTVPEGQTLTVELNVAPVQDKPEEPGRKIPVWAWVAGGVGLAAVGSSIYFGLDFSATQTIVARDCPNNACKSSYSLAEADALQSRWNRSLALTIVSSTVGAACLGAAVYGIVTAPKKETTTAIITPWIGRDVSGAIVTGSF